MAPKLVAKLRPAENKHSTKLEVDGTADGPGYLCTVSQMDMTNMEIPPSDRPKLLVGHVTHVIDPSNFWIQLGMEDIMERFSLLEEQLQIFCDDVGGLTDNDGNWMDGTCYVVARSKVNKGIWMRAQIARHNTERGTVDLFFIDYGRTEIVSLDQICSAVPAFYFAVNQQAWKCGLAGIRPIAKTWTNRAIKYFQKIAVDCTLQAAIVVYQEMCMCHQLALYTDEGDHGRSLAHLMLEEEMGMGSDIDSIAEFARDVTQVFPEAPDDGGVYNREDDGMEDGTENGTEDGTEELITVGEDCDSSQISVDSRGKELESSIAIESINGSIECKGDNPDSDNKASNDCTATDHVALVEPESPVAAIPSFNLNFITKTKMASADDIEQNKEVARKKAITIAMEKDLEMAQQDMEEVVLNTEITDWGASDYHIGNSERQKQADECHHYQKVAGLREAIGDTSWSPAMTEGHGVSKPNLQDTNTSKEATQAGNGGFLTLPPTNMSIPKKSGIRSPSDGELFESQLAKKLSKILDEGELDDPGTLCNQFNKLVRPSGFKEPRGLSVAIEVLLETSLTLSSSQQTIVLNVLDTYINSPTFDTSLETVLKQLESRLMKPAFGKARTYHKAFGQLMGHLLIISRLWHEQAAETAKSFVINLLEKWAIYNRHGYQVGVQYEKTQAMFLDSLEGLWDVALDVLPEIDPSSFVRVNEWLQDKVLASNLPRDVREKVLQLILRLGPVKVFREDEVRPRMASVEVQTESSSFDESDTEYAEQSHPEDISLFSHFTADIEDVSPLAGDVVKHQEPSPLSQPDPPSMFPQPSRSRLPGPPSQGPPPSNGPAKDNPETVSPFLSWAHCVTSERSRPKRSRCTDTAGLRALALHTLHGEKYVFSDKYVTDLPPRFRRQLPAQRQERPEQSFESDPHFYRKGEQESASGLDYHTPRDLVCDGYDVAGLEQRREVASDEECRSISSISRHDSRISGPSNDRRTPDPRKPAPGSAARCSEDDDSYVSCYAKLGLGNFPSVKDITSSQEADTGSDTGSERGVSKLRSASPVDWWNAPNTQHENSRGRSSPFTRSKHTSVSPKPKSKVKSITPPPSTNKRIQSPKSKSGSDSQAQYQTTDNVDVEDKSHISPASSSLDVHAPEFSPSSSCIADNNNKTLRYNSPSSSIADERKTSRYSSPSSSVADNSRSVHSSRPSWSSTPSRKSASAKMEPTSSIKSIVQDIFGEGDNSSKSSDLPMEKYTDDAETDGANTSFNISEVASEVEGTRETKEPESEKDQQVRILPEYGNQYDFDDEFDADDDFDVYGYGDQPFQGDQSSCVDTGFAEKHDEGGDFKMIPAAEEMDFMKPLNIGSAEPRQQRQKWVPGARRCTMCGDSDHTAYSCTSKKGQVIL